MAFKIEYTLRIIILHDRHESQKIYTSTIASVVK